MNVDLKLEIKIDHSQPIDILDLNAFFLGVANQYKKFLSIDSIPLTPQQVKLQIKEVRHGSSIFDLVPQIIGQGLFDDANNIESLGLYVEFIKRSVSFFLNKNDKPYEYTKNDIKDLNSIVNLTAKDNGKNSNTSLTVNGNNNTINFTFNTLEANAAQNGMKRYLEDLDEIQHSDFENVALLMEKASREQHPKSGEKGTIEEIYEKPVAVKFSKEIDHTQVVNQQHPFHYGYLVNVNVKYSKGKPILYLIQEVLDNFLIEDE